MINYIRQKFTVKGMIVAAAMLIGVYLGVMLIQAFTKFTLSEMDWNSDGHISIFEILSGADVGRREALSDSMCTEYYAFKDGVTIKTICPNLK